MEKARRIEQIYQGNLENAGNKFNCLDKIRLIRKPRHIGREYPQLESVSLFSSKIICKKIALYFRIVTPYFGPGYYMLPLAFTIYNWIVIRTLRDWIDGSDWLNNEDRNSEVLFLVVLGR